MNLVTSDQRVFTVSSTNPVQADIRMISRENGVSLYAADFVFPEQEGNLGQLNVPQITVAVEVPMVGILSTYSPTLERRRGIYQEYAASKERSRFYWGAPFLSAIRDSRYNYVTVALSDAINEHEFSLSVEDFQERETIRFIMKLLMGREYRKTYHVQIRIDENPAPIEETYASMEQWFQTFYPKRRSVPAASEYPLYSTWYSFHQHPNAEKLLQELKMAAQLGFCSLILDDGWSYDGPGTGGYSLCGDWKPSEEKFPDLQDFVKRAHALGIHVATWFPLALIGEKTSGYQKYRDKLLYEWGGAGVLDVRYPDVRAYIIETLTEFVRKFDLDGLKLDFIDVLDIHDDTPAFGNGMDIPLLSDAVVTLLNELEAGLLAVKPEIMIEFRQNYVGPAITKYCNMLRSRDCPFDVGTNRICIADMRLQDYNLAVHSDMLYWAKGESAENVARQLLCTMFAVPQISVLLTEYPEPHIEIIKAFLSYWTENRKLLLHGRLSFAGMDFLYPMLSANDGEKTVAVLYQDMVFRLEGDTVDVHNATERPELVLVNPGQQVRKGEIFDLMGRKCGECTLANGATLAAVPVGGRVEIR